MDVSVFNLIINTLQKGICVVSTKKLNGDEVVYKATLASEVLAENEISVANNDLTTIKFFDVEAKKIKSSKTELIKSIELC